MKIALYTRNENLRETLLEFAARYVAEKTLECEVKAIDTSDEMLLKRGEFDAALIDTTDDGVSIATQLRKNAFRMPIVFVAQSNHFSVEGRKVDAMGFLVYPVSYYAFATMLDRIQVRSVSAETPGVALMTKQGARRVSVDEITYVENSRLHAICHLVSGDVEISGSVSDVAKRLTADRFFRLGKYLINLGHVYKVSGNDVYVGAACLSLPTHKKGELLDSLLAFMNRG